MHGPEGKPRLLITAGEASSDAHGAGLLRALRARGFEGEARGIGGRALAAEGMDCIGRAEDLAVMGLFEALRVIPTALSLMRKIKQEFRRRPPDLFIPIDSPDFNLRLAPAAAKAGIPVLYFIAPQLWAWRESRVRILQDSIRELMVLFPFEEEWFRQRGVVTTYVGHPKVDEVRRLESNGAEGPIDTGQRRGVLLPGSRRGEIARHLPVMAEAAQEITAAFPGFQWVLRMADEVPESVYQPWARKANIELSRDPIFEVVRGAQVAACVSGTASFEVALTGTPMVVVYRMNRWSWWVARRLVKVPFAAMANLTAGRPVVPELLQDDCAPGRIAAECKRLLTDYEAAGRMRRALLDLRDQFGPPGAYDRAAERVMALLAETQMPKDR